MLQKVLPETLRTLFVISYRIGLAALLVFTIIAAFYYNLSLQYDLSKISESPKSTVLLDCHGLEITTLGEGANKPVQSKDLPQHLINALLAREDAQFYSHHGIHFKGLARATLRNLKDRSFTQGASTLSMQLTRNCFQLREKSLHRKCLEIALTLRLETQYTKEQILTNYLNRIYFGSGYYGVEQAAQGYFSKTTKELNLAESALLAGIIRGPHIFSPKNNKDAALQQRDQTLTRMLRTGQITASQKQQASQTSIQINTEQPNNNHSYATSAIQRHLQVIIDQQDIRADGLKVHTTIDLKKNTQLQNTLQNISSKNSHPSQPLQTAALTIEHHTGAIRSLIGGSDYTKSTYNRALDSKRDLGPILSPLINLAALERNRAPIVNQPILTGRLIGPTETIRILKRTGLKGPFQTTEDLFRGGAAATPLELATAYSTIAAEGKRPHTYLIEKVTLEDGTVLFENSPSPSTAVEVANAKQALSSLKYHATTKSHHHAAPTHSKRDYWDIKLTSDTTTVLWFGYDKPKAINHREIQLSIDTTVY